MEYDEFGNPLFEEELSDDEDDQSQVSQSPKRDQVPEPLRDFDEEEQENGMQQNGMQVDGEQLSYPSFRMVEMRRESRETTRIQILIITRSTVPLEYGG
jgi:hypothetical protein